jgi:glycosidase
MPKVNYSSPDARKWALYVAEYWIKNFDIDGWRMDVAKEIDTSFWKEFREITKNTKKDILLLSEIFGDTSQWLQGDMFDGTMNYSFRENMIDFFANRNMEPEEFSESLAHLYSMYSFEAITACQNLLSSHDVKRFLNRCKQSEDVYGAIFFQATFPGIASIYYGDEIGLNGGDEPNNREPFPWNDKLNWNNDLKEITSTLMNLKNSNSILKYGTFELIPSTKGAVAFRRVLKDESLICIFNRDSIVENFKISSQAHSVEKIYGNFDFKIENKEISVNKLLPNTGIIIHEK